MKFCTKCGEEKELSEFDICKSNKGNKTYFYRGWCKECRKKSNRNIWKQMQDKFLEMYGGKCACCGETIKEFLSLDHINGQAGKKRENTTEAYKRATKEYRPDLFRTLCHNCNQATKNGRICPHQLIYQAANKQECLLEL